MLYLRRFTTVIIDQNCNADYDRDDNDDCSNDDDVNEYVDSRINVDSMDAHAKHCGESVVARCVACDIVVVVVVERESAHW